jgi:hypothetical protein
VREGGIGEVPDVVRGGRVAVVHDLGGAEGAEERVVVLAGGGDDFEAGEVGELDAVLADGGAAAPDEDLCV